jgi:hypothetical protein
MCTVTQGIGRIACQVWGNTARVRVPATHPISRAGYTELTGSSTKTIILDKTTTITAYGFGYNEDRSGFGGGQITAGGQVTAVKIG